MPLIFRPYLPVHGNSKNLRWAGHNSQGNSCSFNCCHPGRSAGLPPVRFHDIASRPVSAVDDLACSRHCIACVTICQPPEGCPTKRKPIVEISAARTTFIVGTRCKNTNPAPTRCSRPRPPTVYRPPTNPVSPLFLTKT